MGKDYAHRGRGNKGHGSKAGKKTPARKKKQAAQSPGMPGWIWMLVGLTAGLLIAVLAYIFLVPAERAPIATNQQQSTPNDQPVAAARDTTRAAPSRAQREPAPTLPPDEPARFKFYEELVNGGMVPRPFNYRPEPASADEDREWVIQAGSFAREADANTRKAEIGLLGYQSDVKRVELPNGAVTYRVTIGPDDDYDRVRARMARLLENNIDVFFRRAS